MENGDQHPLRVWRLRQGVSLREFAEQLERAAGREIISYASLARIECGLQPPSCDLMRVIYDVTDGQITPNDLLGFGAMAQ